MGNAINSHTKTLNWEEAITIFRKLKHSSNLEPTFAARLTHREDAPKQSHLPSIGLHGDEDRNYISHNVGSNISPRKDTERLIVQLEQISTSKNRFHNCAPICSNQLSYEPSFGHELTGTIVEGPLLYNHGVFFVLEDLLNNAVIVGVFNTGVGRLSEARRILPLGSGMTIKSPTLEKRVLNNSFQCVVIEDPRASIRIHHDPDMGNAVFATNYSAMPATAQGWYQLGNEIFKSSGGTAIGLSNSAECFGRGLIMSSRDIVVLLCNRAAVYLNCGLPAYAARDCAAACHLDPENFRSTAPHRLKVALKALNMKMIVDQLDQFDSDKGDADLQEAYSVMQESMWWEDSDDLMEALHNTTGRITVPTLDQKRQQDAEREEKQQLDHDPQHICRLAASFEQDAEREKKRQIVIPHRSGADTTIRYNGHEHAMTPQQLLLDVLPIENKSLDDDVVHSNFSHFRRSISKGNSYRRLENRSRSISPTRTGGAQPGSTIATPAVGYQAAAAPDGSEGRDAMDDMHGHRSSTRDNGTAGRHVLHRQSSRSESPPPVSSRACGQRLGPGHGGGRDRRDRTAQLLPRGVMLPQLHGLLSPRRDDRPSSRQHISSPFHSSMQSPVHSQHKDQTPRWVTLHKKGVEQFDKQHFDGAAEWFTASMSALVEDDVNNTAAGLLCHRSIKYFQAGKIAQSLVDATVACIINPRFPVAWYRRAIALDRLQHTDAALKAVDTGKSITKAQQGADLNSDFVSLQKQIKKHQAQMEQQAALEQEQAQREKEARERERQRAAEVATQRAAAVHDRLSRGMNIVRTVVGIDLAAEEKRDYWIDYS